MEHLGGDRSSAVSQAVVASGTNSPNNLLQLQPRNQKVCSSARQTAPWVEQEGAGRRQIAPCRGVGAAGMGKGQGVEQWCSQEGCSVFQQCILCVYLGKEMCRCVFCARCSFCPLVSAWFGNISIFLLVLFLLSIISSACDGRQTSFKACFCTQSRSCLLCSLSLQGLFAFVIQTKGIELIRPSKAGRAKQTGMWLSELAVPGADWLPGIVWDLWSFLFQPVN